MKRWQRLTRVCAHFAILVLFENRLEIISAGDRDASGSPSGLSSEQDSDVEWIVGRVWDMCDIWKREMENLLVLAEQFEPPLQKLRS